MFGMQMDDLEGVLRDSPDDKEMQRMAEEEQQQLQQQVCQLNQHCIKAERSGHNTSATCAMQMFLRCCTQAYVTVCKRVLGRSDLWLLYDLLHQTCL